MLVDLSVGDDAWFYDGRGDNSLVKGKVVHVCDIPGYTHQQYVIEVPTSIEPLLYVRDGYSVSDAADKSIGMYRRAPNKRADILREVIKRAQEELGALGG